MLQWLTPAERRGASVLVLILLIGAGRDWWRARTMRSDLSAAAPAAGEAGPRTAPLPLPRISSPESAAAPVAGQRTLDLNRATAPELEALPGIGPVLAARILAFRERQGRFRQVEELLGVRGVGPRLFERLRSHVHVAPATGAAPAHEAPRGRGAMHSAPSTPAGRADSASVGDAPSR